MQWNQSGLAELSGAYGQDAYIEINVVQGEAERFTDSQARYTEQSEQAVQGVVCQTLFRRPLQGVLQQTIDIVVREEVRAWRVGFTDVGCFAQASARSVEIYSA